MGYFCRETQFSPTTPSRWMLMLFLFRKKEINVCRKYCDEIVSMNDDKNIFMLLIFIQNCILHYV